MHFIRPEDWLSSFHKGFIGGICPESILNTSDLPPLCSERDRKRNKYISTPTVLYVQWTQQHINLFLACHTVRLKRLKLSCQMFQPQHQSKSKRKSCKRDHNVVKTPLSITFMFHEFITDWNTLLWTDLCLAYVQWYGNKINILNPKDIAVCLLKVSTRPT